MPAKSKSVDIEAILWDNGLGTTAMAAAHIGVSEGAFRSWRALPNGPKPVAHLYSIPLYDLDEVADMHSRRPGPGWWGKHVPIAERNGKQRK